MESEPDAGRGSDDENLEAESDVDAELNAEPDAGQGPGDENLEAESDDEPDAELDAEPDARIVVNVDAWRRLGELKFHSHFRMSKELFEVGIII